MITPHFSWNEFRCKDGTDVPLLKRRLVRRLCERTLEVARAELGIPLIVVSGYRTPAYNRRVGGATGSWHLKARAADIRPAWGGDAALRELFWILHDGMQGKLIPKGGLAYYSGSQFVHVDDRGWMAWWRPAPIRPVLP